MRPFDDLVTQLDAALGGKLFFLEIGAMDGVHHDALYPHVVAHPEWEGLLVEPLPDMFKKLKATYKDRKNLKFEQAAIAENAGVALITRIPPTKVNKECPDWADGISTLRPEKHIISQYGSLRQHTVQEKIRTMTFAELAEKQKLTQMDLLQIDTEGYDRIIFDQIWAAGFRPVIIKLEALYMQYMEILELQYMLGQEGYICTLQGEDIIAYRDLS
jgi:FkbM family methyltransferase